MDITSANAVLSLTVPGLLTVATQLQGFSADDIFDFEDVDLMETSMGADGNLSAGVIYRERAQTIAFQADSPSIATFEAWSGAQIAQVAALPGFMNVTLSSIGKSYSCGPGFLQRGTPVPAGRRILQPQRFRIVWQTVLPTPVGLGG